MEVLQSKEDADTIVEYSSMKLETILNSKSSKVIPTSVAKPNQGKQTIVSWFKKEISLCFGRPFSIGVSRVDINNN